MKVFVLNKISEDYNTMFRSGKAAENPCNLTIKESSIFKCFTIINPLDSNCLFTLNSIRFKASDSGSVSLTMGECKKYLASNFENPEDSPPFIWQLKKEELKNSIEVFIQQFSSNNSKELLNDCYIIIAPGGSILIKTEDPVKSAELDFNINLEEL